MDIIDHIRGVPLLYKRSKAFRQAVYRKDQALSEIKNRPSKVITDTNLS